MPGGPARSGAAGFVLFALPAAIVAYLVVPPLVLLVVSSFNSTADQLPLEGGAWSLANYVRILGSADTYVLLQRSLIYAFATVMIALTIAALLVWLIERTDLPGRNAVLGLIMLPIAIPAMAKAIGWSLLANPNVGLLNLLIRNFYQPEDGFGPLNIYSLGGIIFVSALSQVPSVVLMIAGAFRSFDPALEEAGHMSGAHWLQTQRLIALPMLKPALFAAFIYYFAYGLEDFQIPAILGMNAGIHVFSTRIYLATHPANGLPDFGLASSYSILLLVLAIILILVYRRMVRKAESYAVVSGRGYRPARTRLGRWKYLALGLIGLYVLLSTALPVLTLLWVSLQRFVTTPSIQALGRMTLANFADVLQKDQFREALFNTLLVAPIVATATMALSTLVAWYNARWKSPGATAVDFLTFISLAVPTVVLGLAILYVYLGVPVLRPVYGTIWILVIAFTTRYITYATRLMSAAIIQIHKALEEAADVSGATPWQVLSRITVPLLLPSLINGWMWVAISSLREATLAVMLLTPGNIVLASLIWSQWQEGSGYGSVAAMTLLTVGLTSGLMLMGRVVFGNALTVRSEGRRAGAQLGRESA
ncbi:MAG TPA: iron ABC transporter permease [Xanthobacteraceae bacterium]|nr:iron ABC transporter permease [Xanthobacteraceae bacterium]